MNNKLHDILNPSLVDSIPKLTGLSSLSDLQSISLASSHNSFQSIAEIVKQVGGISTLAESMSSTSIENLMGIQSTAEIAKQLTGVSSLTESISLASKKNLMELQSTTEIAKQFSRLSSFRALEKFSDTPFSKLGVNLYLDGSVLDEDIIDSSIIKADSEISVELANCEDFELLSDNAKKILVYIYHTHFLPLLYIIISIGMAVLYTDEIKEILKPLTTKLEIKAVIKNIPSHFDKTLLKDYRVTIKNDVLLKETPKLKANRVESLPIGTLIKIIKISITTRSWLYVEAEINGKTVKGWLLRRYTTYFK